MERYEDEATKRLAEIRERVKAATPGPWVPERTEGACNVWFDERPGVPVESRGTQFALGVAVAVANSFADAALIAHAPADLTWLTGEVERLTKEVDARKAQTSAAERDFAEARRVNHEVLARAETAERERDEARAALPTLAGVKVDLRELLEANAALARERDEARGVLDWTDAQRVKACVEREAAEAERDALRSQLGAAVEAASAWLDISEPDDIEPCYPVRLAKATALHAIISALADAAREMDAGLVAKGRAAALRRRHNWLGVRSEGLVLRIAGLFAESDEEASTAYQAMLDYDREALTAARKEGSAEGRAEVDAGYHGGARAHIAALEESQRAWVAREQELEVEATAAREEGRAEGYARCQEHMASPSMPEDIATAREEGRAEGVAKGRAEGIADHRALLGISVDDETAISVERMRSLLDRGRHRDDAIAAARQEGRAEALQRRNNWLGVRSEGLVLRIAGLFAESDQEASSAYQAMLDYDREALAAAREEGRAEERARREQALVEGLPAQEEADQMRLAAARAEGERIGRERGIEEAAKVCDVETSSRSDDRAFLATTLAERIRALAAQPQPEAARWEPTVDGVTTSSTSGPVTETTGMYTPPQAAPSAAVEWKEGDAVPVAFVGRVFAVSRDRLTIDWPEPLNGTTVHVRAGRSEGAARTPIDSILARVGPPPVDRDLLREVIRAAESTAEATWPASDGECDAIIDSVLDARRKAST